MTRDICFVATALAAGAAPYRRAHDRVCRLAGRTRRFLHGSRPLGCTFVTQAADGRCFVPSVGWTPLLRSSEVPSGAGPLLITLSTSYQADICIIYRRRWNQLLCMYVSRHRIHNMDTVILATIDASLRDDSADVMQLDGLNYIQCHGHRHGVRPYQSEGRNIRISI